MKRPMKAKDIRHLVFGNPYVQLGDKTISIKEVSKAIYEAIYENEEIRKQLSEHAYEKIKSDAKDAHCDFANYVCYGENDNEEFFAVEIYKFKNIDEDDEFLFIAIAKQYS